MYSIHTRDDLEKLKKLQETKSSLKAERLKEKLGKQDFHYDLEEVFEPVTTKQVEATENQKQLSEKQIQALHDSTRAASQTTVQAIKNQTQAIRESSNALSKNLQKSIKEGIQEYDEITNRNNQLLTSLVTSNQVDSSIVKTVSNLLNDKNKSQFSLEPITQDNPNLFTINPHNPQQVLIKGSTMIFENGNSYDLSNPDLQYFITNTQFDKPINNWGPIYNFLNDMKYDLNYGDKNQSDINLLKNYTLAINCRATRKANHRAIHAKLRRASQEVDCEATQMAKAIAKLREVPHEAPHNSTFSSHLTQTN